MKRHLKIGDLLVEENKITQDQLLVALGLQKGEKSGQKLGDILVGEGYLTERQLMEVLAKRLKLEFRDLSNQTIDTATVNLLDESIAKQYGLVPIDREGQTLTIAMSDPMNLLAIEDVRVATKMNIISVISTPTEIRSIIERCYSGQQALSAAQQLEREYQESEMMSLEELTSENVENAPVVKMVNSILLQGIKLGASDIHIEANQDETRVRMRIDGQLQEQIKLGIRTHEALITRLKIMGNMNIAEKRIPQDGRCEVVIDGQKVDMRLASIPGIDGEKMVLRILGTQHTQIRGKEQLGLTPHNMTLFDKMIESPNGIILVTGPTGSGKSTTLYAVLKALNGVEDNIITLEDPVEKRIKGVTQVQINPKAGLTFASGLRAILRQDPNIIMVGEIRDKETAQIAIRAAITGHLVFSTLHTNDAVTTVMRLMDMGVEPYLVASALVGVVAQRLVRVCCDKCKHAYSPSIKERQLITIDDQTLLYKGRGCQHCNFTGYKGRAAIHEIITVGQEMKDLIASGATTEQLRVYCQNKEVKFLESHMRALVLAGETTSEEYAKVTYRID
ncbi:MAG: GspE/PulE family protein [Cellulosilyticaceae bacterium]